jgi:hypothetical protein
MSAVVTCSVGAPAPGTAAQAPGAAQRAQLRLTLVRGGAPPYVALSVRPLWEMPAVMAEAGVAASPASATTAIARAGARLRARLIGR